jgi:predicted amidohydrolase
MMRAIKAAAVQFEHSSADKGANVRKLEAFVKRAAEREVDLIAFPECCITGYWFLRHLSREQIAELAEDVPGGPACQLLLSLSQEHKITIGAGLVELGDDDRLYNTYVVTLPDGTAHRHRKLHCFVSEHLSSGSEFTVFNTPFGLKMAVLTCWDNNLIENARICALEGAQILLAPHQTGGCHSRSAHGMKPIDKALWENRRENPKAIEDEIRGPSGRAWLMRWLPSRAHDNGMFLIFSNGVGMDDDEVRTGNAMILDPYGRVVAETWQADDEMVVADLELELLINCTGGRWLRGRRPELYWQLIKPTGKESDIRSVRFGRTRPAPEEE